MAHIALLDCNNFFVSCERLFRPDLRTRPVVVLSSNDGCVVARSNEIKDIGIPMGVPYFQIKDTLDEIGAVIFSSHFALYRDVSRRVFEVVKRDFASVEQYSVDECFIEFSSNEPEAEMRRLKDLVEREVGIPVSIGISASKTQAKFASKRAKRTGGICYLTKEGFVALASEIKLGEIWGIGRGRSTRFSKDGVYSALDLILLPRNLVSSRYGIEGVRLQSELAGVPVYKVERKSLAQKSLMSTRSFSEPSSDPQVVKDAVLYHIHQAVADLNASGLSAWTLRVLIAPSRYSEYALFAVSKEAVLTEPSSDLFTIKRVAISLFEEIFKAGVPYKRAGIVLSRLVESDVKTASLFGDSREQDKVTSDITKTIMDLNKTLGANTVSLGRLSHKNPVWKSKQATLSPAYTTNWKDIRRVRS